MPSADTTLWISENQYLLIEHQDGQGAESLVEEQTRTCPSVSRMLGWWVGERSENLGFPRVGCDLMHDGDSYIRCDNDSYRDNCFYSHCNDNR